MSRQKNLKRNLLICLLAGSAVMYTLPLHAATSVVANNALPQGGQFMGGSSGKFDYNNNGLELNVHQNDQNAVIKWGSFDVGGSATVNFTAADAFKNNFNTLNYVNSGSASQIYGTINGLGGNIYVVNTAGVQIGPSAQINVGSLYVSNNVLDDSVFNNFVAKADNAKFDLGGNPTTYTDAALMSLGNINANNVTFEGNGRIVIDSERITNDANNATFRVNTNDAGNVLIGYDAYEETFNGTQANSYKGKDKIFSNVYENGSDTASNVKGYMWVEDVEQLQKINTNLGGNYALRNSIDATSTEQKNFISIGSDGNAFTGKFDGIDYNIFGLTINSNKSNTGLFGETNGATINNVTLVGGKITGGDNTGALVGYAIDSNISNVVNSAEVNGNRNVGGLIGAATNSNVENAVNTGTIHSDGGSDNHGDVVSSVGGLIGSMYQNSTLDGNSYNLGDVSGKGYNVGGLVGHAVNSTIGDGTHLVYNRLDVTGKYNVGGIVGNMEGTTVQNAENSGNVTATGYTAEDYIYHTGIKDANNLPAGSTFVETGKIAKVEVNVANVGGIAGKADDTVDKVSKIENVTNTGNVGSNKQEKNAYYDAGNVGGIVGSAVDTNITNATNKENDVRGAHNVGGVAGYFSGSATITGGINDGGDIMATGARNESSFVVEMVRPQNGKTREEFIIGNIGGVVGYLEGDDVYVTGSANRGTVHTYDEFTGTNVPDYAKAANVGGVVGKIDREIQNTLDGIKGVNGADKETAAVTNSYNTGDVLGYTGVGGVIGMMYNGAVSGSYNLGTVNTTRQVDRSGGSNIDPLNMGGIVGDTTEETNASAIIYDVYNKGQIGDEEFNYYARHVGGIVGRLSGDVEKAYNTGDIYNNDTVVGGIAGWWYKGNINNAFNTGNITAITATELQVGGLVGAAGANANNLTNAYNLGTIRGYQQADSQDIYLGGIVGKAANLSIDNVYTLGNLYAGRGSGTYNKVDYSGVGYIYGGNNNQNIDVDNSYYITSEDTNSFSKGNGNGATSVDFGNRYAKNSYGKFSFSTQTGGIVSDNGVWRIYEGSTTPILNAFLPNTEKYFGNITQNPDAMNNITSIQYGTAYDPLLTIINAKDNLIFDWDKLGIGGAGSLVVYGGGLTLDNVSTSNASGGSSYYGGVLYSDGALTIDGKDNENLGFGSASELYGSEVTIKADGTVTIYGDVTATGNAKDDDTTGNVTINAGDVNVYGTLTSATAGKDVSISGIANKGNGELTFNDVNNPYSAMPHVGDRFNINITAKDNIDGDITITAGQNNTGSGNVNLYFGNKEEGLITTGGNLTVTGTGDVFVDSDLDIKGNMTLTSTGKDGEVLLTLTNIGKVQANRFTEVIEKAINGIEVIAANTNKLIDAINLAVGKEFPDLGFSDDPKKAEAIVRTLLSGNNKVEAIDTLNNDVAIEYMHDFMHSFERSDNQDTPVITLSSASGNSKLTVDMWEDNDNGTGQFNFEKYDSNSIYTSDEHTFVEELNNLNLTINDNSNIDAADVVYVEVHNGEQLKGIQDYVDSNVENASDALKFNYALMGDINASDVENYEAIGTGSEFTGTFDGRGNRIIGLNVNATDKVNNKTNAGIFSTIGNGGTVKNVNIYSGNFTGTNTAGAVAGVNNGRIENVTGFGNTVTVTNANGNAGGIVGVNKGDKGNIITNEDGTITLEPAENEQFATGIIDVESIGSVIAESNNAVAGGLVGTNDGALGNSYSDSAVTSTAGTSNGLGGVVGVNKGDVQYVDSLGVTNGGTSSSSNVGGIIGVNNGNMYSGYNESIVSGSSNVGGIIGTNAGSYNETDKKWTSGTVENVVNATSVTSEATDSKNTGGLVGTNTGSVTNGRNNGTITGTNYVGGLVGDNADEHSILTNLVNDSSAEILGEQYVGGIAGSNSGKISATNDGLTNRGSITGNKFVGGVAGVNTGEIANTISSIVLNAKGNGAQFFGGVVGQNSGLINGATNTSDINITAVGGSFVGGIIGQNTESGKLKGEIRNEGSVAGQSQVGGIIGQNNNDKVLQGTETDRLIVANDGTVDANEGGAAGIFYENNGDIKYADISNSGDVDGGDKDGGTGGLFGINTGNITESTLTNSGTVSGGGNVGGLIGVNSGNADNSSLTNTGSVTGINNVGGLIGENTGTITGGRDDNNSYYKDQIYNNGTITGRENGSNIGGLIGYNTVDNTDPDNIKTGSLTAGYNTGTIKAENSSNVGGIVGNNAGTVDQVFNTVMTGVDDKGNTVYGTITGKDNVGGLVGTNSGTLSNAYNTTAVKAENGVAGNAVGVNVEVNGVKGQVSNVYDVTKNDNKLIGKNSGNVTGSYSGNKADKNTTGITYVAEGDRLKENTYQSSLNDANTWKFYDGNSNPLLKVFLTNLTVNETVEIGGEKVTLKDYLNLVYNGKEQDLNIADLIDKGFITAPNKELLNAYKNTLKDQSNGLGESYLLDNADGQVDAKGYSDWLYSNQITANTDGKPFNPNNLGYDITYTTEGGTIDIGKLSINITLDDIYRIYGNVGNIFSDSATENKTTYEDSYHVNTDGLDESLVNYIKHNLKVTFNEDEAIVGDKTQNVGSYDWSMKVTIDGDDASNYQINSTGLQETIIKGENKSHVEKADLTISIGNAETVYGDAFTNADYSHTLSGITNGDNAVEIDKLLGGNYVNEISVEAGRDTANAGTYTDMLGYEDYNELQNYNIKVEKGDITVTKADLTISVGNAETVYGDAFTNADYSHTLSGITNGDNAVEIDKLLGGNYVNEISVEAGRDTANAGTYTDMLGYEDYNELQNYNIKVEKGDITVTKADLTISVGNAETVYGDAFTNGDYSHTLSGITNGDKADDIDALLGGNYVNGISVEAGKATANAGTYEDKLDFANYNELNNYNIKVEQGDVVVTKADLNIEADNITSAVGNVPKYTGTDIQQGLVNGDTISDTIYNYGVSAGTDVNVEGNYTVGIYVDGSYYELSYPDWSTVTGLDFLKNYNVTFTTGTLTVTEQVMPDLPDNWPNNRWDYLFGDNPFDRNENFRERKAEVNFVDGAMEI